MINEFKYTEQREYDDSKILKCCPEPKPNPSDPPSSDCCYNTWQAELDVVNWELKEVTNELTHAKKHLTLVTTRYTRLKLWDEELSSANELAFAVCRQLEIIEAQLVNICKNTQFTVKGVEILEYRESFGGQVRDPAWLAQFTAKHHGDALVLTGDIRNISGATLSSKHITGGVKRLLSTYAIAVTSG